MKLTAIIEREGNGYVSLCPELHIASQGESVGQARDNLLEALELFFESSSREELKQKSIIRSSGLQRSEFAG
jgi:predicted RNase H-like HicB family nuclease